MTQFEFEKRIGMEVSSKEFDAINEVYMNSELDKDQFCKVWAKMNKSRIASYKAEKKEREAKEMMLNQVRDIIAKRYLPGFDWRKDAIDNLTNAEIGVLARVGIQVDAPVDPYGVTYHKTTIDVWYEMDKIIANA